MRGVSLDEIAAATRISTRFLEALEKERWDQLPGGAFNRGFIRSIARFLGIDEDGLVAEYAYGHEGVNGAPAAPPSEKIPRNYRPAIVATALLGLLMAGGIWALTHYGSQIAARVHGRVVAEAPVNMVREASQAPNSTGTIAAPPFGQATANGAPADPPTPSAAPVAPNLALTITAAKRVDIRITADGKSTFSGKLKANEAKLFEAHDTFEIVSSKSAALALNLNGHTMLWAGAPNNPRKMTLTRNDLPASPEPSH